MPKRSGAVHVATTRRAYKGKVYETHLLRRTYREGGKVKHETLGNLSHLPSETIDLVRRHLKGETFVCPDDSFRCTRSLPHGHVAAVLGSIRRLELDRIIESRPGRRRNLVMAMVAARILDPRSKLATARGLSSETAFSSLGHLLGIDDCDENELYDVMDWLQGRQAAIEKKLAARHLNENTLVLYDVTSTYFEGRKCPLAKLGHSRDGKKGKLQIVFGVLCTKEGCPIAVEVFRGNTGDPQTVASQIRKLKDRFGLDRVVIVGDRGMLTEARIRDDMQSEAGLSWITALRAPSIRRLVAEGEVDSSLFDERDIAEIRSPSFPGERLVACFNPLLADDRTRKRQELLAATEKDLARIQEATRRRVRPLRGKDKIGLRLGRVINKHKVAKHFEIEISDTDFRFTRNQQRIAEEEALDGIYVIRTDLPKKALDAEGTVKAYKSLSSVERAFRSVKTIDLKVRPIYHYNEERVRAHVFLCMLAYYVEWHMRQQLAPVLFDDDDKETAEMLRASPVAPAQRSMSAKAKDQTKRTVRGTPVHSFRTLLADLGTIVINSMTWGQRTFTMVTEATPVQREALELLKVSTTP